MNDLIIGRYITQPGGYKAFIPHHFPPKEYLELSDRIIRKHTEAIRLLGKLDGITELLPDKNLFLRMFIRKDASSSSQIEGTNASLADSVESENVEPGNDLPQDVDDILHYINALDYGIERMPGFVFNMRFVRELHERLMLGARSTQLSYPGEFHTSQNWISGTSPANTKFVPPPIPEMKEALSDLEKFINADDSYLPLVKAALIHAQFETIHPFNDGNGRTGRMLITMFLWDKKLLEMPILYLSTFFKKHQSYYYERLNGYHNGEICEWVEFFLDGVIETANSAIKTCAAITKLREQDMMKIQQLNRVASEASMKILLGLYKMPIVGIGDIKKWTKYTDKGSYNAIDRMEKLGILSPMKKGDNVYAQKWIYSNYWNLFDNEMETWPLPSSTRVNHR